MSELTINEKDIKAMKVIKNADLMVKLVERFLKDNGKRK